MKKFLAAFFLIGMGCSAWAQSSKCEEILNQATEQFGAGHFFEIPSLLQSCIDHNEFTNEQKVRAYLLLTQTYLILDAPSDAETSYLKLLKADPEYVATEEKDAIDVVYLSKKFTSTPIFTPHVKLGLNTSFYRNVQYNNALGSSTSANNSLRIGFQFGGGFDWNITNNWSLCAEGVFGNKSYKRDITGVFITSDIVHTDKRFGLDIPVYLKYAVDKGQIRPYGYAGLAGNLLLSSKSKLILNSRTGSSTDAISGQDVDYLYLRKTFTKSFVLGGGIKYKIGKDFVYVDVRYMAGLSNLTTSGIYAPKTPAILSQGPNNIPLVQTLNQQITQYGFVNSYSRLDNLSISFGYVRPLYDPRKIRKVRVARIFHIFDKKEK